MKGKREGKRGRKKIADLKKRPLRQSSGSPEELKALALSWLDRPAHDIIVCPSLIVVDGHRRLEGLELLGETEVEVFVTEEELDDNQILQVGLTTAIHRADLGGYDKWQACVKLLELNPSWDQKTLADNLHLSASSATHITSPSRCAPKVQQALKDGLILISDCNELAKASVEEQDGLLNFRLSHGAGRSALQQEVRKLRQRPSSESEPQDKSAKKVNIAVATDVARGKVTVAGPSGEEIDLEGTETLLREALKMVRSAKDKSLTVRSAVSVWADMAKAGS